MEKKQTVELKYNIKNYEELKKVMNMTKKLTKNREVKEINFNLIIDYYLE